MSYSRFRTHFNSHTIGFSEWMSLITLSLTPLLAHIWAGAPHTATLSGEDPRWHDRIMHLNPTSIFWRYCAITKRRLNAEAWSDFDLGLANTAFWVNGKWDGTGKMMDKSKVHCFRRPEKNRTLLISESTLKTIIVSLQGVQAFWDFTIGLREMRNSWSVNICLPTAFEPFAMLGLVRLFAALWLSDDTGYLSVHEFDQIRNQSTEQPEEITEQPEMITTQLEKITEQPEKIMTQPEKITTQPDKITEQLEKIAKQPENNERTNKFSNLCYYFLAGQLTINPQDQVLFRTNRSSF
jgi:hypothetical protein